MTGAAVDGRGVVTGGDMESSGGASWERQPGINMSRKSRIHGLDMKRHFAQRG